ncbi:F-box/kelch-repeat protein At3g23880-like [Silene latifolia]|uniref:F-box/kelch-repeat protein At3g23880-like n=1 Tax=Silene latifolia TaxID=37657 RepID=UPI003D782C89
MESSNIYNNLPLELWTNHILPTLPVKTLLRFRSVCKLWRDTIDDLHFVSKHFTLSMNNADKNQVLSIEKVEPQEKQPQPARRLTVRNKNTLRKQADLFEQPDTNYYFASCNGLFLVQPIVVNVDEEWRPLEICTPKLWNPSIRKSLTLPTCPLPRDSLLFNKVINQYVFGFRPSRDDYVVFAFRVEAIMPMNVSVAVYTLSDNLWNIRDYNLSLSPHLFFMLSHGGGIFCPDGVLHWFGRDLHPMSDRSGHCLDTRLISFDFEIEKFSDLELPDVNQAANAQQSFRRLFVLGESLALFSISSKWSSIWVLKDKLWNLWFTGTKWFAGFDYIRKNPSVYHTRVFVENGGDITLVYGKASYKIMSDEIQEFNELLNWSSLRLDTYIESLVLHKGCRGQIIDSL